MVSVGIPTFQRALTLRRAIESVRSQTFSDLELVIADNASEDDTQAVCEEFRRLDPRVRYVRQSANLGPTENINSILLRCRGEYIIFLGDDDWLESNYLEHCVAALAQHPDRVLARGRTRYYDAKGLAREASLNQLTDSSPASRVRAYYRSVDWNEEFYGLIRQTAWQAVGPLPRVLGNDFPVVAKLAFIGKAVTLTSTQLSRATGGIGDQAGAIAAADGISRRQARAPFLTAAWFAWADIAWRARVYESLSRPQRAALAFRCIPPWLARRYAVHLRRVRVKRVNRMRRRLRRLNRGAIRRFDRTRKRARTLRRRLVRFLRRRMGAAVGRR